jgi:hypothetical protein
MVLAAVFYRNLKVFKLGPFLLLLMIVCITESCAGNVQWFNIKSNYTIYNVSYVISAPLYLWIFINIIAPKGRLKIIYTVAFAVVMCFLILNLFCVEGPAAFDVYSVLLVEFTKCVLALLVITKLLSAENYEIDLSENPYFWIAGATIIFGICAIILFGLQKFIVNYKIQIGGESIYRVIIPLVNPILYSSYCYAFYLCRKLTRKLSLQ